MAGHQGVSVRWSMVPAIATCQLCPSKQRENGALYFVSLSWKMVAILLHFLVWNMIDFIGHFGGTGMSQ